MTDSTFTIPEEWQEGGLPFGLSEQGDIFLMEEHTAKRFAIEWTRTVAEDRFPNSFGGGGGPVHAAMETSENGIAVIKLKGVMAKSGDLRWGVASTEEASRQVARAKADSSVRGILLSIDSPGGMSAGSYELAEEVAEARKVKPTWTHFTDVGASAAYWVGSQAEKVFANETAWVGSIGTYMVVPDLSKMLEKLGIEMKVYKAGDFKAAGYPGTPITAEHDGEFQKRIDSVNSYFVKGFAKGRGLPIAEARSLADGRAHMARDAQSLKLIDGVQSLPQTLAQLTKHVSTTSAGRSKSAMSETSAAPQAATIHDLEQAFPKADASFHLRCLKSNLTVAAAQGVYATEIQSQLTAMTAERDDLKAKNATLQTELDAEKAKPKSTRPGAPALADSGNAGDEPRQIVDPQAEFRAEIEKNVAAGMTRRAAASKAAEDRPDLQNALVRVGKEPSRK